ETNHVKPSYNKVELKMKNSIRDFIRVAGVVIVACIISSFTSIIHNDEVHSDIFDEKHVQNTEIIRDYSPLAKIYYAPLPYDGEWNEMNEFQNFSVSEMDAKALAISIKDLNYHFQKMSGAKLEVILTDR